MTGDHCLEAALFTFNYYKDLGERAMAQLSDETSRAGSPTPKPTVLQSSSSTRQATCDTWETLPIAKRKSAG